MAARTRKTTADPFIVLAKEGLRPVYAIDGVPARVDELLAAIRAEAFPPGAPGIDFNLDQLSGKEVTLNRVIDAAQTLPAFAPRRLVIVKQAEALLEKGGEEAVAPLLGYLDNPSPTTTLVFVASDKLDGRTKVYKALKKTGAAVRFEPPREAEMPRVVTARARALGVEIEPDAVRALVEGVGTDVGEAYQALERVALYVGPDAGRPIRREDVEAVVRVVRETSVFALVDAIAEGDRVAVIRGLHSILEEHREHGLRLLAMVARQYRNLLKARVALEQGEDRTALPSLLGLPPFAVDKLLPTVRSGDVGRFARALAAVAVTDRALKGGPLDDHRDLDRLVLALRNDLDLERPRWARTFSGPPGMG